MIFVFSMIVVMISIWSLFFLFLIIFLGYFVKVFIVFNYIIQIKFMVFIFLIVVAPDIAVAHKLILKLSKKNRFSGILFF
jgi:hypothetical protein